MFELQYNRIQVGNDSVSSTSRGYSLMKWYSRLDLKVKFALVTSIVVITICAGFFFFVERIFKSYLKTEMEAQASEIADNLNGELANYMGPDTVQETSERYLAERRDISRIVVYDRNGLYLEPIVKVQAQELPDMRYVYEAAISQHSPLQHEFQHNDKVYWEFAYPRMRNGEIMGLTAITLNFTQYKSIISAVRTGALLMLITGLISMLIVTNLYVKVAIRRPLAEIVSGMEQVQESRFDVQLRPRSQDEIGQLAEGFNRMTRALGAAQEQILEQTRVLEEKVHEATSELRSRNMELFQAQDELRRANRLATAGQVAAMLAHELGSPLSSISGHLQLMLENSNYPAEEQRRLQLILTQVERLSDTIHNFLKNVTGPESSFMECRLNDLLHHMIELTTPVLQERKVEPVISLDENMPPIQADPNQLQQLFLNLFTNAIDAMREGGSLSIKTRFVSAGDEEYRQLGLSSPNNILSGAAVLYVQDTGSGMDADHLKNLFHPFFSTKEFGRGSGLGLSICKQIVKAHGGQIQVKSEPGKGTVFTIILPVHQPVPIEPALQGMES